MMDEFQQDFSPHTERRTVSLDILTDDWDLLPKLFNENEWELDHGLRYTLTAGLAYLQRETSGAGTGARRADLAGENERLQRERMDVESRYAVMRYGAFTFMQAAKLLEMKLNACRMELEGLRTVLKRLRAGSESD
jgi:hypothetical protein